MLSSTCRSEEFACKPGYKRFSDGSTRCYPTSCQEGALQASNISASIPMGTGHGSGVTPNSFLCLRQLLVVCCQERNQLQLVQQPVNGYRSWRQCFQESDFDWRGYICMALMQVTIWPRQMHSNTLVAAISITISSSTCAKTNRYLVVGQAECQSVRQNWYTFYICS